MSVCYYFLNLLRDYESGYDTFLTSLVFLNILFTNEDKILIKNLFELNGYYAKHLVREFASISWNLGFV